MLDCARCETLDRTYRWVETDPVKINGTNRDCRVIEFSDDKKHGRRWLLADDFGVCIARVNETAPQGTFSMRLLEMSSRAKKEQPQPR